MAKNVSNSSLGRPLPDAQRPRNPFDRSYSVTYNTKHGYIEPIFQLWAPAGSHVKINRKEFFRSADVNTSAFLKFDHFIDFFAVKLSDLWSYWDNWYLNLNDMKSSLGVNQSSPLTQTMRESCPAYSMQSILNAVDVDLPEASRPAPGTGEAGGYVNLRYNARRLLSRLRYPINYSPNANELFGIQPDIYGYISDKSSQYLNVFPLCAYQKIYYEHYRNSAYESQNPFFYNLDWLGTSNDGINNFTFIQWIQFITNLHSVNYRKDFVQAIYPALNYIPVENTQTWELPSNLVGAHGEASVDVTTGTDFDRWTKGGGSSLTQGVPIYTGLKNLAADGVRIEHTHAFTLVNQVSPETYSVQAIRAAFALDKLKRASAYAPRNVKSQYEARFGFKYRGDNHESIKLGSFHSDFMLNEVTQTSPAFIDDQISNLGTIGGKGLGASDYGKDIEFDCGNSDYIILGMSYFVQRVMYDNLAVDPFIAKFSRNDFFQPEFENLGLQPLYQKFITFSNQSSASLANAANNIVRGYQTRYEEYKTGKDINFGLFTRGNPLNIFTSHFNLDNRISSSDGVTWQFFKALPSDVDNLFVENAQEDELSDQFFGIVEFKCICNQNMSIHGQPKL